MALKRFAGDFKLLIDTTGTLTGATPTYTEIANIISIPDPDSKLGMREQIDSTSFGSEFGDETTSGRRMQGDGIPTEFFFDPLDAAHQAFVTLAKAGTPTACQIEAPIYDPDTNSTPASWTFDAYLELQEQSIEPTGDAALRRYSANLRVISTITKTEEAV